jgi:hypothetical protein
MCADKLDRGNHRLLAKKDAFFASNQRSDAEPSKNLTSTFAGQPLRNVLLAALRLSTARALGIDKPRILLACMPKSASSFLANCIGNLPGMAERSLTYHDGREIDLSRLALRSLTGFVSQQHIFYSELTNSYLKEFKITPVVLIRNLFDVVVSMRDHLRNEAGENPAAQITPEQLKLKDSELELIIADMVIPWYFNFFLGWKECANALWVHYNDVKNCPEVVIERIAEKASIPVNRKQIEKAILKSQQRGRRFNVGKTGRGASIDPRAREKIERMAAYYPNVDFRSLGL